MALNDIWEVRLYTASGDQVAINALHYQETVSAGTGPSAATVALFFENAVAALMKNILSVEAEFAGVEAQKIAPIRQISAVSNTLAGDGTILGDPLPGQVTGITAHYTALSGRAYRGRSYWPFPGVASLDTDGTPTAGYVAALRGLVGSFIGNNQVGGAPNNATLTFGLYHRKSKSFTASQFSVSRKKWATQRRRGDYGRPNALPF